MPYRATNRAIRHQFIVPDMEYAGVASWVFNRVPHLHDFADPRLMQPEELGEGVLGAELLLRPTSDLAVTRVREIAELAGLIKRSAESPINDRRYVADEVLRLVEKCLSIVQQSDDVWDRYGLRVFAWPVLPLRLVALRHYLILDVPTSNQTKRGIERSFEDGFTGALVKAGVLEKLTYLHLHSCDYRVRSSVVEDFAESEWHGQIIPRERIFLVQFLCDRLVVGRLMSLFAKILQRIDDLRAEPLPPWPLVIQQHPRR